MFTANKLLLLFVVITIAECAPHHDDPHWQEWKQTHNKSYHSDEHEAERHKHFVKHKAHVDEHNAEHEKHGYKLKLNHLVDMSPEEFMRTRLGGFVHPSKLFRNATRYDDDDEHHGKRTPIAPSIDWRNGGAVNPVQDQNKCGACWTFGTTAALEGRYKIVKGQLLKFAEQNVLNCAGPFVNNPNFGCNGGSANSVYDYVAAHGINLEQDYPYTSGETSKLTPCQQRSRTYVKLNPNKHYVGPLPGEQAMLQALQSGPINIAVDVTAQNSQNALSTPPMWKFVLYGDGIYSNPSCTSNTNHIIALVGYGTANDGTKYWIVRNSWGVGWGKDGYMHIKRGVNMCGIESQGFMPYVVG